MSSKAILVWLQSDLRLDDNPALFAASKTGRPVIPVFIFNEGVNENWRLGAASRWWLHHALQDFNSELESIDSRLLLRTGKTIEVLQKLVDETKSNAIYFHRRYSKPERDEDEIIQKTFSDLEIKDFSGNLLYEPQNIQTKQGKPYQVYTPYWNACLDKGQPPKPLAPPKELLAPASWPKSEKLSSLSLLPTKNWDEGMKKFWKPEIAGARELFKTFRDEKMDSYKDSRDIPALDGTSRLSPFLHFGQLSSRRLWSELYKRPVKNAASKTQYLKELVWREFAYHLLFHFPQTDLAPLREDFKKFPWASNPAALQAWQKGQTGYPLVDAGMRQLWQTGWMHNRVRMVVASFLVKHLLLKWQDGAKWFWDTLVDADLASNTLGWQWSAGCGADAAPFFRIFNPITQSQKFDREGTYLREWVPELTKLDSKWIHEPWAAPADVLKKAGIVLGITYPQPMVDHKQAREKALKAFEKLSKGRKDS